MENGTSSGPFVAATFDTPATSAGRSTVVVALIWCEVTERIWKSRRGNMTRSHQQISLRLYVVLGAAVPATGSDPSLSYSNRRAPRPQQATADLALVTSISRSGRAADQRRGNHYSDCRLQISCKSLTAPQRPLCGRAKLRANWRRRINISSIGREVRRGCERMLRYRPVLTLLAQPSTRTHDEANRPFFRLDYVGVRI
jgi:hypothetical protein